MTRKVFGAAIAAAVAIGMLATSAASQSPMGATGMNKEPLLSGVHDGLYVGLTAGTNAASLDTPEGPNIAEDGLFGGAYIGFGAVRNGTYLGVEVDGMFRDIRPSITDGTTTITMNNRWLASARGRVGMPIGPALLYATGGVAVQEAVLKITDPIFAEQSKEFVLGLVIGAGIQAQLTDVMHVRIEGLHYAWQDEKFSLAGEEAKIGQADTVFRVGLGFKLQTPN
jgi:outer membrane immunogenic protein